ncbi:unnamed protein product, partial [marine sediment metagenome]
NPGDLMNMIFCQETGDQLQEVNTWWTATTEWIDKISIVADLA